MALTQEQNVAMVKESLSVLVADDDTPTRILLRAAISQWGYTVVEAKDGEEAWEIMQQQNAPRLLIIDWLMPKLNGIELCERIKREISQYSYIILLTQQVGTTNIIKGLEAGADEFLSKPFNMAELRSRLSIGNRIISYELVLAKQNEKLGGYVDQIEKLLSEASTITQEMGQGDNTAKLQKLNILLMSMNDLIREYKQSMVNVNGLKK